MLLGLPRGLRDFRGARREDAAPSESCDTQGKRKQGINQRYTHADTSCNVWKKHPRREDNLIKGVRHPTYGKKETVLGARLNDVRSRATKRAKRHF